MKVWLVEHLEALLLADQPDARATANGGDSLGEFCLSGLQLHKVGRELTSSPPRMADIPAVSEIIGAKYWVEFSTA